jgi:hypothetical protein
MIFLFELNLPHKNIIFYDNIALLLGKIAEYEGESD